MMGSMATATATPVLPQIDLSVAPRPDEVDRIAAHYIVLRDKADQALQAAVAATAPVEKLRGMLVSLVTKHGSRHADKSKILHGVKFELVGTFGTSRTLDKAAVLRFQEACIKAKHGLVFRKVFTAEVGYRVASKAAEYIRGWKLPTRLIAMFAACEVVTQLSPRLQVRPKKN